MILEVRGLTVQFPSRRGILTAVDDVSFSIAPGEVLGVVGESGAGKSMTGAAIIGLIEAPGRIGAGEIEETFRAAGLRTVRTLAERDGTAYVEGANR